MKVETVINSDVAKTILKSCPIVAEWILEGAPEARNAVLSSSRDGDASTLIWDCTAGRFKWIYDVDESIYVLQGGVVITDEQGHMRRLNAGDTVFFPAGARAVWHVEHYIRKIAFCRTPLPKPLAFAKRCARFVRRRIVGRKPATDSPFLLE